MYNNIIQIIVFALCAFSKPALSCVITIDKYAWVSNDNELFTGVNSPDECLQKCIQSGDGCQGYTWEDFTHVCLLFKSLNSMERCESCISGTTVEPVFGGCNVAADTIIDQVTAESEQDCWKMCAGESQCTSYTWFDSSAMFKNTCFMFSSCIDVHDCTDCFSGRLLCIEDYIEFSTSKTTTYSTTNYPTTTYSTTNYPTTTYSTTNYPTTTYSTTNYPTTTYSTTNYPTTTYSTINYPTTTYSTTNYPTTTYSTTYYPTTTYSTTNYPTTTYSTTYYPTTTYSTTNYPTTTYSTTNYPTTTKNPTTTTLTERPTETTSSSTPTTSNTPTTTVSLPPQCSNYKVLDDKTRSVSSSFSNYCDERSDRYTSPDWSGSGHYRVLPPAGIFIADSIDSAQRCGTDSVGYLMTSHPSTVGESVDARVCFTRDRYGDCERKVEVNITNCNGYFVYYLNDVFLCSSRYCAADTLVYP